jgi:hypothetical protein
MISKENAAERVLIALRWSVRVYEGESKWSEQDQYVVLYRWWIRAHQVCNESRRLAKDDVARCVRDGSEEPKLLEALPCYILFGDPKDPPMIMTVPSALQSSGVPLTHTDFNRTPR